MVLLSAQDVQLGAAGAITQASAPPTRHLGRRRDRSKSRTMAALSKWERLMTAVSVFSTRSESTASRVAVDRSR